MKKFLLALLTVSLSLTASAENTPDESTETGSAQVTKDRLEAIVSTLKQIKGYVFLSPNETRELSKVFARTEEVLPGNSDPSQVIKNYSWKIMNPEIAQVHENTGLIEGFNYGETILTVYNEKETNNFIVFVCPTITVEMPEGAIYSHQKIYGQRAKVNFTKSNNFVINCVMQTYTYTDENNQTVTVVKDITDQVAASGNSVDGYYETEGAVLGDIVLNISMEDRDASEGDAIVGNSGVRLRVEGHKLTFVAPEGKIHDNTKVTITANNGKVVYNGPISNQDEEGNYYIEFLKNNLGVFFVNIEGINGSTGKQCTYKIILTES